MNETTKAMRRRLKEHDAGGFPWRDIFKGRMIDVGCGPDKLPFTNCIGFDQQDGDANCLSKYFASESFDVVHGSHVLEHMNDPRKALRDWLRLVKRGGFIVQTVPDWVAYEGMQWPSRFNPDHRSSWSTLYKGSIAPIHIYLPEFLNEFSDISTVRLCRYVEENYNWSIGFSVDQTLREEDGVAIWNEFVIQKH